MIISNKVKNLTELKAIPLVTPKRAGSYWKGTQFGELLEVMLEIAKERNWYVENYGAVIDNTGKNTSGFLVVNFENDVPPKATKYAIGYKFGNDRRYRCRVFSGLVTSKGLGIVTSKTLLQNKATREKDLKEYMRKAFTSYKKRTGRIKKQIIEIKQRQLRISEVNSAVIHASKQGVLRWRDIGRVLEFYETHNQTTSWGLYIAFSHVIADIPPLYQLERLHQFFKIIPK